ncbi:MAG: hypothetical protein KGQ73_02820 [Gammaproteobacteria bacterium]|nr:hypothetical protein [Gammaproteobacteria bacterium]
MKTQKIVNRKTRKRSACAFLGVEFIISLALQTALANPPPVPTCNALVSVAGNLYLVGSTGQTITKFTSDGTSKNYVTVSPDGRRVAYALSADANGFFYQYHVVDSNGRQESLPVYDPGSDPRNPNAHDFDAMGPLMGMWWNSNDVLKVIKHVSPSASFFEFHRIDLDLDSSGPIVGTGWGDNCALKRNDIRVACVQDTDVSVGDQGVFYESGFPTTPIASFTVAKGSSITTSGNPAFTVKIVGFYNDQIGIEVTSPAAPAVGGTMYLPQGNFFFTVKWDDLQYGFSATLADKNTGLVRINEFRRQDTPIFDSAIAWRPHRQGLLLIHRENGQAILYLIQPRHIDDRGVHELQRGGQSWTLVAQTPINMPSSVQDMHFLTPAVLFFQTENGTFSWAQIHISNDGPRHDDNSGDGAPTLTVGAITQLPPTVPVTLNGTTTQTTALDWSCSMPSGNGDSDNNEGRSGS